MFYHPHLLGLLFSHPFGPFFRNIAASHKAADKPYNICMLLWIVAIPYTIYLVDIRRSVLAYALVNPLALGLKPCKNIIFNYRVPFIPSIIYDRYIGYITWRITLNTIGPNIKIVIMLYKHYFTSYLFIFNVFLMIELGFPLCLWFDVSSINKFAIVFYEDLFVYVPRL